MVLYLLSFVLGVSIGSFVQVIVTRFNVAKVINARSKCLSCGEALRAIDLIPIVSHLLVRGKCRYCKSPFGIQSLIIEIMFGLIFVTISHFFLSTPFILGDYTKALYILVYYTLLIIILGVIALYDSKHMYIPNMFVELFLALSLVMMFVRYTHEPTYITLLGPLVIALPFLCIWLISRGRALGFGDVIMYVGVGAFFGISQGLAVLLLSIWLGALFGIMKECLMLIKQHKTFTSKTYKRMPIPFVPFIVIAFLIILFTDIDIQSITSLFAF